MKLFITAFIGLTLLLMLSACGTLSGIASDVNAFTNPPRPYYYGPPGQRRCWWSNGRRWCRY